MDEADEVARAVVEGTVPIPQASQPELRPTAVPLCFTISVLDNVRLMRDWFTAALDGVNGTGPHIINPHDPAGDMAVIEQRVRMVYGQLYALGYLVPDVQGWDDLAGFLSINAEFLTKVEPWLVTQIPYNLELQ